MRFFTDQPSKLNGFYTLDATLIWLAERGARFAVRWRRLRQAARRFVRSGFRRWRDRDAGIPAELPDHIGGVDAELDIPRPPRPWPSQRRAMRWVFPEPAPEPRTIPPALLQRLANPRR